MNIERPNSDDYDDDEPYVLEQVRIGPAELSELVGMPLAADSCEFVGCDLSHVSFHGVKNTRFVSSKLRGTRFTKHLTKVAFVDSQLAECRFRMMGFKGVDFENCQLIDCDFYGSELTAVTFAGTSIKGVGFDACTLSEVDLTGATSLLIGDPRTLTGTVMCETQIPLIATRLAELSGIEVQDC